MAQPLRIDVALAAMTDEELQDSGWTRTGQGKWHHPALDRLPFSRREAVLFCVFAEGVLSE